MSDDAVFSRVNLSIDVHARVLICCHDVCRVALSPSPAQVSQHLRTKHNIPAAERRLVTDLLKDRISPLQSPSEAPVRQDGSSPDPNLHLGIIHRRFIINRPPKWIISLKPLG
ncbi:hypothetical protein HZ326_31009 [Fusarium oxysporum f. sp. albedinis]|nr:hypothetical protein HZ326_31009 [Fusarium oxysporum f. sp. albedinis]